MSFALCYFAVCMTGVLALFVGYRLGYWDGSDDGWEDGYNFSQTDAEIQWRVTMTGAAAPGAERTPLADLTLHPTHDSRQP